jgi:hypothetical protein
MKPQKKQFRHILRRKLKEQKKPILKPNKDIRKKIRDVKTATILLRKILKKLNA